jgi:hypothetical protein
MLLNLAKVRQLQFRFGYTRSLRSGLNETRLLP